MDEAGEYTRDRDNLGVSQSTVTGEYTRDRDNLFNSVSKPMKGGQNDEGVDDYDPYAYQNTEDSGH